MLNRLRMWLNSTIFQFYHIRAYSQGLPLLELWGIYSFEIKWSFIMATATVFGKIQGYLNFNRRMKSEKNGI